MLVSLPAYLEMCQCGEHGCLVLADGTKQEERFSKSALQKDLMELRVDRKITELEYGFLKKEIERQPHLANTEDNVSLLAALKHDIFDQAKHQKEQMGGSAKKPVIH